MKNKCCQQKTKIRQQRESTSNEFAGALVVAFAVAAMFAGLVSLIF